MGDPPSSTSASETAAIGEEADRVAVWDLAVRLFHWSLVALVGTTLATGFLELKSWLDLHVIAGTAIAVLVVLRLIWGFAGSTYARFASFIVSPGQALRHLGAIRRGEAPAHVGHNPVGAMMIVALLGTLMLLVATGALVLGGVLKDGPLAPFVSFVPGRLAKEAHELLAFGLLGLIALHLTGVVAESLRTRDNLVAAMLRGWKLRPAHGVGVPARRPRPVLAAVTAAPLLLAGGAGIVALARLPVPGVPTARLDAIYAKECSSCHSAHHPSVASAATWAAVMARLDDHFGDNASLDEPVASGLAAYLAANSAEHWDTKAAHWLARADANEPLRITATFGWRRLHRHVDTAVFARRSVGGKLNCSRCHSDAEMGRFDPRAIAIPEEKISR
jgi:cytochrome b